MTFPSKTKGNNSNTVITKLIELNQSINQAIDTYQSLILKDTDITKQSVQSLVDTDNKLANQRQNNS
ncbi:YwqI/YxiC family protein [Bacillus alkalicola]|uniref:YwqI/YxiC family protein n=1 Tax=Evansella alkalicola TaxID=745819 RepID=A0ABS6JN25_9BACI|nr:YwqI/YxiC family protein [Bacillus alkalicola]